MPTSDPQKLAALYAEHGSVKALARHLGKAPGTVRYHMRRHGIPVKRRGYRSPKSSMPRGPASHNWKGGTYLHSDGYVYEFAPDHPAVAHLARGKRYVFQHRLVMERELGRYLRPDEDVHHINEIKTDNRPENLSLTSRSPHISYHKQDAIRDARGRFTA